MDNFIIIAVMLLIVALAVGYVIKVKKNGRKCIGCPGGCENCSGGCHAFSESDSLQK